MTVAGDFVGAPGVTAAAGGGMLCFAGQDFHLLPDDALFWPDQRALIVADLHLEKASSYAPGGQLLPPYDSQAAVTRLSRLADQLDARSIWCLGDSFHDRAAHSRMPSAAAAALRELTARRAVTFVAGNHDGLSGDCWGGRVADELQVGAICLRHASDMADPRPEISGHFHPKLRIRQAGTLVTRRCFAISSTRIILPAFGALAGGMDVGDPAIGACMAGPYTAYVATRNALLGFAVAEVSPTVAKLSQ